MSELVNKLNEYRSMGDKFYPEDIVVTEDIWALIDEIERLNNIINEARDYIRSKSIKFTMAYVEDDGRIDLSRSDYRIDKLTSKQAKELLEILNKGEIND